MMSPEANFKLARRASWSGYVYIAFLMVGIWMLAGFFPSQPPTWDAEQITAVYHENTTMLKLGMVLVLVGSMFYVPWTAVLATLISRVEGKAGILTYCQIIAGGTNVLLTAYPAGWWLTAAYRADRDPEIVLLLNDIAWLQFLGVIAPFYFVVISIIYASFADRSADPLIPRWVGYFNVFFMFELIPLSIIFFFKSGPFAWNGLFGFYAPFVTFWVWFFVMTYTIRRSLSSDRVETFDAPEAVNR
ncbi:hypothetical protein [Micromonospora sp. WMMD736]|uniref:hypothetical protein n=1 Tax=Micromonospora sp. WMMD736 TaxID=3404112 RepID=UPI003B9414F7